MKAAAEIVRQEAGGLDVLINNAGIAGAGKPVGEVTAEDMRNTYGTNVFGVVRVTRAFLPVQRRRPGYTATDLNGHQGTSTVEESADVIVRMATIGADGPTGGFFDKTGPVVW